MALSLGLATTAVLVLLSAAEWHLAAADRDTLEVRYAAESAFDRAVVELQSIGAWDDVLAGTLRASFGSGPAQVRTPTGIVDLEAERQRMQARTDAVSAVGPDTPRWRLFGWGRLEDLLPVFVELRSEVAVAVWVADDEAETDGAADRDGNQSVWLRAVAYGPRGARRAVEGLVVRETAPPGPLRRVIWRDASEG